ncbi:hypothetical protein EOPP23_12675 [Endozoicomonas sp. OPT23]|uniref:nuclear transport factor 2 family protein n=1 Tax=Endozoicomonas sp. OPT23 TaxID=2072845 RepID=UPI00129B52A6|nr:nuclear transport factor 2 family protein [Endozoicomonas sp. OPT23]MRI33841.1 hypothetical protein [Endozoicomonas sp. OPT23]
MSFSLQALSDRYELEQLIYEYSDIIDRRRFDDLNSIFTKDAFIDYTDTGGIKGDLETIKQFLEESFIYFPTSHHLNANIRLKVDGDSATGTVMCLNPMEMQLSDESRQLLFIGLWYHDTFVRTQQGWKFSKRVQEKAYDFNKPDLRTL